MEIEIEFRNGLKKVSCPLPEGIQVTTVENSDESITLDSGNYVLAITESVSVERQQDGASRCVYHRTADVAYPRRESRAMPNRYDPARVDQGTVKDFSAAPSYDLHRVIVSGQEMPNVRTIYADGYEVYRAEERAGKKNLQ